MTTHQEPEPVNADLLIGEQFHAIMWRKRFTQVALGASIGMGSVTLNRKLRGERHWTIAEIVAMAGRLGVSVEITGDGQCIVRELPRLDSNQQPSGYRILQVVRSPESADLVLSDSRFANVVQLRGRHLRRVS